MLYTQQHDRMQDHTQRLFEDIKKMHQDFLNLYSDLYKNRLFESVNSTNFRRSSILMIDFVLQCLIQSNNVFHNSDVLEKAKLFLIAYTNEMRKSFPMNNQIFERRIAENMNPNKENLFNKSFEQGDVPTIDDLIKNVTSGKQNRENVRNSKETENKRSSLECQKQINTHEDILTSFLTEFKNSQQMDEHNQQENSKRIKNENNQNLEAFIEKENTLFKSPKNDQFKNYTDSDELDKYFKTSQKRLSNNRNKSKNQDDFLQTLGLEGFLSDSHGKTSGKNRKNRNNKINCVDQSRNCNNRDLSKDSNNQSKRNNQIYENRNNNDKYHETSIIKFRIGKKGMDESVPCLKRIIHICTENSVDIPEFTFERTNDLFLCTAEFMNMKLTSRFFKGREDAKNDVCKNIMELILRLQADDDK